MSADPADLAATSPSATEDVFAEGGVAIAVESVPEGKIVDFLTSKLVNDTPEAYVRQNIEKALVKQYGYPTSDCTPEVQIKVGSGTKRVDIVIFDPGASSWRCKPAEVALPPVK